MADSTSGGGAFPAGYDPLEGEGDGGPHEARLQAQRFSPAPSAGIEERPYLADHFEWAAPGDQQEDAWLARFCDKDCSDAIFTGPDAEREAWEYWNRYAPGFNIYVFRLARLSREVAPPPASNGAAEAMREALSHIARSKYGLQGIQEDHGHDTNAYNYHALKYYMRLAHDYERTAANALALPLPVQPATADVEREAKALVRQLRAVIHRLYGQAYSSTLSQLNALDAALSPSDVEAGKCVLCAGKCRGHGLGDASWWSPEPGSAAYEAGKQAGEGA